MEISPRFTARLEDLVKDHYLLNDPAHDIKHARIVVRNVLHICSIINVTLPQIKLSIISAYFHDMYANKRVDHHTRAYRWVALNSFNLCNILDLSEKEIAIVATACLTHRASYKGEYSNIVSEIVSAADKGPVDSFDNIYKRALNYASVTRGLNPEEAKEATDYHMHEKYGRNGYAKYSPVWEEVYGKDKEALWLHIDSLSAGRSADKILECLEVL